MRMKVFIGGGTGFIGSEVAKAFASRDHEVTCLAHQGSDRAFTRIANARYLESTVQDLATLDRAVDGCDIVINAAGITRERPGNSFEDVHIAGTRSLTEAAKSARVRHFVHISALGAAQASACKYFKTKAESEAIVKEAELGYTILKPSIVFGPGDTLVPRLERACRYPCFAVLAGQGWTGFQPIAVADVAAIAVTIAEQDEAHSGKAYELAGPKEFSYYEMLDLVLKAKQRRKLKLHLPISFFKTYCRLAESLGMTPSLTHDEVEALKTPRVTKHNAAPRLRGAALADFEHYIAKTAGKH